MNHDVHDDHDDRRSSSQGYRMRLPSPLTPDEERVMGETIGSSMRVHRVLGPGYLESIYTSALCLELTARGIPFERERSISVDYCGTLIPGQRVDLIVAGLVIVEVKAVVRFDPIFEAKLISYLRTAGLRAGLLVNFHEMLLKNGLKRVVL